MKIRTTHGIKDTEDYKGKMMVNGVEYEYLANTKEKTMEAINLEMGNVETLFKGYSVDKKKIRNAIKEKFKGE